MERKIKLKNVNPCITCVLCKGYLIDATTITECLHTFCKTCIVRYLEVHTECPQCHQLIHQSHPLNYISHDRTMQDIVYKLVPDLQKNETDCELEFYRERGLPLPTSLSGTDTPPPLGNFDNNNVKDPLSRINRTTSTITNFSNTVTPPNDDVENSENTNKTTGNGCDQNQNEDTNDYHKNDEQVSVRLKSCPTQLQIQSLKRQYIRCSSQATITHLKKYLALKLYEDRERYRDVEILCNEEPLGKDHTLKFITVTRWRAKDKPLSLTFRQKMDL